MTTKRKSEQATPALIVTRSVLANEMRQRTGSTSKAGQNGSIDGRAETRAEHIDEQVRDMADEWGDRDHTQSPRERNRRRRKTTPGLRQFNTDLPEDLVEVIDEIARREHCSKGSAIGFLVYRGLVTSTADDLRDNLETARSVRFDFKVKPLDYDGAQRAFFGDSTPERPAGRKLD